MQPTQEGGLWRFWLEAVKDTLEGVMAGDAIGHFEEALQPVQALACEGFDIGPGVGAGDDGADGDGEDVAEQVALTAVKVGILERANLLIQRQT